MPSRNVMWWCTLKSFWSFRISSGQVGPKRNSSSMLTSGEATTHFGRSVFLILPYWLSSSFSLSCFFCFLFLFLFSTKLIAIYHLFCVVSIHLISQSSVGNYLLSKLERQLKSAVHLFPMNVLVTYLTLGTRLSIRILLLDDLKIVIGILRI